MRVEAQNRVIGLIALAMVIVAIGSLGATFYFMNALWMVPFFVALYVLSR